VRGGRRAAAAGVATKIGNHSFRATGSMAYLKNGGTLEKAAQMANHASTPATRRSARACFGRPPHPATGAGLDCSARALVDVRAGTADRPGQSLQ
jgi:hypothetical protein